MGINISSNMVRLRSRVVQVLLIFTFFALYAFFLFFDHPRIPAATSSSQSSSSSAFNSLEASILPQVFISVKTTGRFHKSRVDLILKTWFKQAPSQTYFFTDVEDKRIDQRSNGHLIQTNCSSSHNRKALCCKMSVELDTFLKSDHKWFCHFDDDNYVHVGRLMELLQSYDPHDDWYLGKPSIRAPLQILDRKTGSKIGFWFATGGAGFCLSRSLVMKMIPSARYACAVCLLLA